MTRPVSSIIVPTSEAKTPSEMEGGGGHGLDQGYDRGREVGAGGDSAPDPVASLVQYMHVPVVRVSVGRFLFDTPAKNNHYYSARTPSEIYIGHRLRVENGINTLHVKMSSMKETDAFFFTESDTVLAFRMAIWEIYRSGRDPPP
jgi:hypothetical protein